MGCESYDIVHRANGGDVLMIADGKEHKLQCQRLVIGMVFVGVSETGDKNQLTDLA